LSLIRAAWNWRWNRYIETKWGVWNEYRRSTECPRDWMWVPAQIGRLKALQQKRLVGRTQPLSIPKRDCSEQGIGL